ncbi:hypothetical protein EV360DRAFT_72443 [Lentinula raphanica]|nr:hypothetical protein EV360DRAFT_72443 [Lentinula raphanica]
MTRPVLFVLPLGIILVLLASTSISPAVLAAQISSDGPGLDSRDVLNHSSDGLVVLEAPVLGAQHSPENVHGRASYLPSAGAGAGPIADGSHDGSTARQNVRNIERRARFIDGSFLSTRAAMARGAPSEPSEHGNDPPSQVTRYHDPMGELKHFDTVLKPIITEMKAMKDLSDLGIMTLAVTDFCSKHRATIEGMKKLERLSHILNSAQPSSKLHKKATSTMRKLSAMCYLCDVDEDERRVVSSKHSGAGTAQSA